MLNVMRVDNSYLIKCPYCKTKVAIKRISESLDSIEKNGCLHVKILNYVVDSIDSMVIFFRAPFCWSQRGKRRIINKAQQSIIPFECKVKAGDN
jgi:hypothetical protein